ncbi:MAG: AMP-binding protein [Conexibacter sp.]|nr:AMP-binding protein [Conexibacter sp.]
MAVTANAVTTYGELVRDAARRSPDVEALVFSAERLTYAELRDRAERRARELSALGVGPGDHVGVLMPNDPAIVELFAASALVGATLVPINTRFKVRELRHVITDARLKALFTTDEIDEHVNFTTLLHEALPGLAGAADPAALALDAAPDLRAVVLCGERGAPGILSGSELRALGDGAAAPATATAGPDDVALLLYTSGTTAHPKGCMLSHRAVMLDAQGIAERFAIPAEERWWDPLPMFHAGALLLMTGCFVAGATFISMPRFDLDEAFALIEQEKPSVLYPLFPTITLTLQHDPRFAALDRSGWRVVVNVGPHDVQRQIQEAYAPATLMSAYGITELCGTVVFTSLDDPLEARVQTCGQPLPGFELKVVDPDTGAELEAGQRGELLGRGPSRFLGYYRHEDLTREVIDEDGFFHTGDLCSLDADGRVCFHGRLKDMLKVGGENVAAVEIESFLATHPAVKMAQVVGVPDPRLLEVPAAFIELAPGAAATEPEIIAFCKGSIAGFKVPRVVRFVDEWPMSATKVQKFRLRDALLAEVEEARS